MVAEWSILFCKDPVAVIAAVGGRILSLIFRKIKNNLDPVAVVAAVVGRILSLIFVN